MAQSDLTIENQSFPSFRTDLNNALTALNSMQSGTSRPASAVAGTMWLDTTNATNPTIKFFDGTDDITFATVDYSANTINFSDSASDLLTDTTPQLGGMLDVNGQAIGDGTLELIKFLETASAVNEITITNADTTNAPEISATGDDTDIDLKLTPKGDGKLNLDGIKFPNADGTVGQALTTDGSGSLAFSTISGGASAFRNIVINGDMSIAQRSTSVASITGNGYYTVDRYYLQLGTAGTWTQSQSTDVPTGQGFATSYKMDCTTADASPSAGSFLIHEHRFEGQNLQYLKKGTASALSLTASFWVKSTKTGTFILELDDRDNGRSISKSYTVIASDTWEKKTITFEGDTTGVFSNGNGNSLRLKFWLVAGSTYSSGTLQTTWGTRTSANQAVGQVNIADDTANDFYITGVQLEAGTTDTDFEFLPYDVNLARCQRYYQLIAQGVSSPINTGFAYSTTQVNGYIPLITTMRATPTVDTVTGSDYYRFTALASNTNFNVLTFDNGSTRTVAVGKSGLSGLTSGSAGFLTLINASSYLALSAEL